MPLTVCSTKRAWLADNQSTQNGGRGLSGTEIESLAETPIAPPVIQPVGMVVLFRMRLPVTGVVPSQWQMPPALFAALALSGLPPTVVVARTWW